MNFEKTGKYSCVDKKMNQSKKIEMCQIISHSDDSNESSSSDDEDLKDWIATLGSSNSSRTYRNEKWHQRSSDKKWRDEEMSNYTSDENSYYETANSGSPSCKSLLNSYSPSTIRSISSQSELLRSDINDTSDETSSTHSVNCSPHSQYSTHTQKIVNTSVDEVVNQQTSNTKASSRFRREDEFDNVPSLHERCFVIGIPETTIDEGITRIIPMKFTVNENRNYSLPRQLFNQMSLSSSERTAKSLARNNASSLNTSNTNNMDWESTTSLSSIDVSCDKDYGLQTDQNTSLSKPLHLEMRSSSPEIHLTSSDEDSEKCSLHSSRWQRTNSTEGTPCNVSKTLKEDFSSSISFNSEHEKQRLDRKTEYEKMLECLNLKSSDESDSSSQSSVESLASAVQRSIPCSFVSENTCDYTPESYFPQKVSKAARSHPNTNTSTNDSYESYDKISQRRNFNINSSYSEEGDSNLETSQTLNIDTDTVSNESIHEQRYEKEQKSLLDRNVSHGEELYQTLDQALLHDNSDLDDSLDESALLDLHDKKCIERYDNDLSYMDFDPKELDEMIYDGLEDGMHVPSTTSLTHETENVKQFKHHSERPNLVDTVDKILRLGSDDVALHRLNLASENGKPLQSIDGTVMDKDLETFAVDFTKPRSADEDTFYWVPCDFKDYLQVSDRPLVSDYFPKNSTSSQFCCIMVREFVHVHFYLRLHESSQPSYAKYNIVIWDKNRQPVAHFRSHAPIFFQAGHAHHLSTFSNQTMQELLGQEMLVVSCHITSFAK